jgi:DNA-binding LacI/PurR family transcriptional regulator
MKAVMVRPQGSLALRAPRVGVFVDGLVDGYQTAVVAGAYEGTELGAHLVCFVGGILGSPLRFATERNQVYALAGEDNLDALMLVSGAIGNHVGTIELARFAKRYRPPLPMCSIGIELEGMPSVIVDNDSGMERAISHLIDRHGHRRIAFVRGPLANEEAERRFGVYERVLIAHGIPLDPRFVTVGDFEEASGRDAVQTLFDERGLGGSIEAIVASNDLMAIGVMDGLEKRGVRVPDVAVIGFDDIEECRYTRPQLTTVRQPLREQGREAVRVLLSMLRGERAPSTIVLPTELVIRSSCGCATWDPSRSIPPPNSMYGFEASLLQNRQKIVQEMSRAARGAFFAAGTDWESRLLTAFSSDLRGDEPGAFVTALEHFLEKAHGARLDPDILQDVLSALRKYVLPCLAKEPDRSRMAEDLMHQAARALGHIVSQTLGRERLRLERSARVLTEVTVALFSTSSVEEMLDALAERLPGLDVRSCFIALYEPATPPPHADAAPARSRLVLAYQDLVRSPVLPGSFTSTHLLPPELLQQGTNARSFVVAPLSFRHVSLGFILIELNHESLSRRALGLEALHELVGAALHHAQLLERLGDEE